MIHSARPPRISHSSLMSSGESGARKPTADASGKRKEDILKRAHRELGSHAKVIECAGTADATLGEQNEASIRRRARRQGGGLREPVFVRWPRPGGAAASFHGSALQIEAIKWLVHEQHGTPASEARAPTSGGGRSPSTRSVSVVPAQARARRRSRRHQRPSRGRRETPARNVSTREHIGRRRAARHPEDRKHDRAGLRGACRTRGHGRRRPAKRRRLLRGGSSCRRHWAR